MTTKHASKLTKKDVQTIRGSFYSIHGRAITDHELNSLSENQKDRYLNYEEKWWHICLYTARLIIAGLVGLAGAFLILFLLYLVVTIFALGAQEFFYK